MCWASAAAGSCSSSTGCRNGRWAAQRSGQVRLFRRFETLVAYLRSIGVARFDVDAADFDIETPETSKRPDRAEALKRAHAAAAHETWFKAQVQASLDDPRPNVADGEARATFAARQGRPAVA